MAQRARSKAQASGRSRTRAASVRALNSQGIRLHFLFRLLSPFALQGPALWDPLDTALVAPATAIFRRRTFGYTRHPRKFLGADTLLTLLFSLLESVQEASGAFRIS